METYQLRVIRAGEIIYDQEVKYWMILTTGLVVTDIRGLLQTFVWTPEMTIFIVGDAMAWNITIPYDRKK